ncbi:MAG TPA: GGDEF domain-containing protein, partial [Thiotrichaceae bacterium]|nr:GGDEF domain-containing protein [Thiotrichaceae bacterium]
LLWGGVALYLFPNGANQVVIYVLLISIIMASMPLLLASKMAFYTQLFLVLSPITLRLLFDGASYFLISLAFVGLIIAAVFAANYLNHVVSQLQETQLALQAQADTDQLTQLANRRAFDVAFKREWQGSVRKNRPISLLILDIDEFKLYNDTYGHLAGDETLKKIAKILRKSARRSSDVAARIGGEEFAILLPDTDTEGARFVAERMQQNISRLDIEHPLELGGKLTVSIGISCCEPVQHQDSENILYPAMLVKSADYAMYKAKSQGRNGIMIEGCGMHSVPDSLKNMNNNKTVST